jgi:SAM-dependent methyltransferase
MVSISRLEKEIADRKIAFFAGDIHDIIDLDAIRGQIDLIILKDTIEHIVDQARMMRALHSYLRPGGAVFFGFPPWLNPFGGHQQLADSWLRYVPWFHVLPRSAYHRILQLCGEPDARQKGLLEIHDTRLSIHKFEKLLRLT